MTLQDTGSVVKTDNGKCIATGGYDDINEGAQVVITDDAGATLAITNLGVGWYKDGYCKFFFFAAVPGGKDYYGVTVTHRGLVKESEADLADVVLSIGSGL